MRSVGSVCGMQMDMHEVTDIVSEMFVETTMKVNSMTVWTARN